MSAQRLEAIIYVGCEVFGSAADLSPSWLNRMGLSAQESEQFSLIVELRPDISPGEVCALLAGCKSVDK